MSTPIIEISNLSVIRGGREILRNVSLSLEGHESLAVLGPNGAGKTTLLRCILGGVKPSQGRIQINGIDADKFLTRQRARIIGYVPQHIDIVFSVTVSEFLLESRYAHIRPFGALSANDREVCERLLESVGLQELRESYITQLSGGERQRVMIAAALAQEPKLLLLDEPTTGLDPKYVVELLERLKELKNQVSLIIVSHDINRSLLLADRALALKHGQVVFLGTPNELVGGEILSQIFEVPFKKISGVLPEFPWLVAEK